MRGEGGGARTSVRMDHERKKGRGGGKVKRAMSNN